MMGWGARARAGRARDGRVRCARDDDDDDDDRHGRGRVGARVTTGARQVMMTEVTGGCDG